MLASTYIESPEPMTKATIPPEYYDYKKVFSKAKASVLPPHQSHECAIDLLPGPHPRKLGSIPHHFLNKRPWRIMYRRR